MNISEEEQKLIQSIEREGSSYLTLVDKYFRNIQCIKNYDSIQHPYSEFRFYSGSIYKYLISEHNETGVTVYIVISNNDGFIKNNYPESYFNEKSFSEYFDSISSFREEKLKQLGI